MSSNKDEKLLALVQKYDRPGPRYTSYPTAPEWSDKYGVDDYIAALTEAGKETDEPLSFYLHIPFCRRRCWFCGCTTMTARTPDGADAYLNRVEKEVTLLSGYLGKRKPVSQFHWGGGTPSFLSEAQTRRAFDIFAHRFQIENNAEISIELDPRVTTPERINLLKELGFNRLSFGIQDFDSHVQAAIGRNQEEATAVELYNHSRALGFTGINFDLIYGLPGQNRDNFRVTLEKVARLRPDRVALYSFAYLPRGKAHQLKIDVALIPSAPEKFALFLLAREVFAANGYVQIGMDHFVVPSDELALAAQKGKLRRNFMGYTINAAKDWIGAGMSSISYVNNNFAQNLSSIESYYRAIDDGRPAVYRGLKLSRDDLIRQHIISELMCNFRLDLDDLKSRFAVEPESYLADDLARLGPFLEDGILEREGNLFRVTAPGKIFVRNMAMAFDAYLNRENPDKPKVQFSRTI